MSKDKQIDEMAKLICTYPQCIHYNIIGECTNTECQTVDIAENLFAKGYRKASDVAREIFEGLDGNLYVDGEYLKIISAEKFNKLKKKYTEENNDAF